MLYTRLPHHGSYLSPRGRRPVSSIPIFALQLSDSLLCHIHRETVEFHEEILLGTRFLHQHDKHPSDTRPIRQHVTPFYQLVDGGLAPVLAGAPAWLLGGVADDIAASARRRSIARCLCRASPVAWSNKRASQFDRVGGTGSRLSSALRRRSACGLPRFEEQARRVSRHRESYSVISTCNGHLSLDPSRKAYCLIGRPNQTCVHPTPYSWAPQDGDFATPFSIEGIGVVNVDSRTLMTPAAVHWTVEREFEDAQRHAWQSRVVVGKGREGDLQIPGRRRTSSWLRRGLILGKIERISTPRSITPTALNPFRA